MAIAVGKLLYPPTLELSSAVHDAPLPQPRYHFRIPESPKAVNSTTFQSIQKKLKAIICCLQETFQFLQTDCNNTLFFSLIYTRVECVQPRSISKFLSPRNSSIFSRAPSKHWRIILWRIWEARVDRSVQRPRRQLWERPQLVPVTHPWCTLQCRNVFRVSNHWAPN